MKRVAIWAAVSSLPQAKKISLEDQLATGRTHAERHSARVVAELVVPGESRDIVLFEEAARRIEAYSQLEALIRTKSIDVLIYLDRSRLGRTAALSMAVAELCNRASILLYEIESPPASLEFRTADHSDMLIGAIKSVDAQQEIRKIQERHRKGMIGRVEKGKMPGLPNYGYVPVYGDRGKLENYAIDEEAATTIRLIVDLYLNHGYGTANIADHLNRIGRLSRRGVLWGETQIRRTLGNNWRYAGYAEINRTSRTGRPYVRAKGIWPPIITEEQAHAIDAERKVRLNARRSVYTAYRYTRMAYCAVCGSRLHTQTRITQRKTKTYIYVFCRCPAEHTTISEKKITQALTEYIRKLNDDESFRAGVLAAPTDNPANDIATQLESLQAQLENLKRAITKADHDHYIAGTLDAERHQAVVAAVKQRMIAAGADMTTLQDRLLSAQADAQRADRVDDLRTNGLHWLLHEDVRAANAWLRQRVRVYAESRQVVTIEAL